jgi:DNA-binding NtrC family response regulator
VTTLCSLDRARDQILNRFVNVFLCDLETPDQATAIEFIRFVREKSPQTAVIAMSRRVNFESIAPAFRAGAVDVIPKAREHVHDLRERVLKAVEDLRAVQSREQLLNEFVETNDELLRKLMDVSRQAIDLEDKLLEREGGTSSAASGLGALHLLVVDDRADLAAELARELPEDKGWRVQHAQTGGEALDSATQIPPQVVVAKESLPDLTGTMVVKTIKANVPGLVAMLFTPPSDARPGEVKVVDQSRLHTLIPNFSKPADLVAQLAEVRDAMRRKARERRYVKIFQNQNLDLLQRCHRLKQRLSGADK